MAWLAARLIVKDLNVNRAILPRVVSRLVLGRLH
jgi:hypothetical protein